MLLWIFTCWTPEIWIPSVLGLLPGDKVVKLKIWRNWLSSMKMCILALFFMVIPVTITFELFAILRACAHNQTHIHAYIWICSNSHVILTCGCGFLYYIIIIIILTCGRESDADISWSSESLGPLHHDWPRPSITPLPRIVIPPFNPENKIHWSPVICQADLVGGATITPSTCN